MSKLTREIIIDWRRCQQGQLGYVSHLPDSVLYVTHHKLDGLWSTTIPDARSRRKILSPEELYLQFLDYLNGWKIELLPLDE